MAVLAVLLVAVMLVQVTLTMAEVQRHADPAVPSEALPAGIEMWNASALPPVYP